MTESVEASLAETERHLRGRLQQFDDLLASKNEESAAVIAETRNALSELTQGMEASLAETERQLQGRLQQFDDLLASKKEESAAAISSILISAQAAVASIEQQAEEANANVTRTIASQYHDVQVAAARAHAETAASLRSLRLMMALLGIVVFVAAVLVGRLLPA